MIQLISDWLGLAQGWLFETVIQPLVFQLGFGEFGPRAPLPRPPTLRRARHEQLPPDFLVALRAPRSRSSGRARSAPARGIRSRAGVTFAVLCRTQLSTRFRACHEPFFSLIATIRTRMNLSC